MVQLGHETPVASMDKSGKLVVAVNNVISAGQVRAGFAPAWSAELLLACEHVFGIHVQVFE